MKDRKILILVGLVVVIGLFSFLYSSKELKKYSESKILMGTIVNIDVCDDLNNEGDVNQAFIEVWKKFEDIAFRMSSFEEESEVGRLNNSFFGSFEVSPDTYQIIKNSLQLTHLTDGAFDITVWPLIQLWKKSQKEGVMPVDQELSFVMEAIGPGKIAMLEDNRIQFLNPNTKIDLGGIAKGFAIDEAARIFRKKGIENFYIDAGGDAFVGGLNCEKKLWKIGVRDPRSPDKIMDVLALTDTAVVTSGNYARFFEIEGNKLSHIVNPVTGYPQEKVASSTVIGPNAQMADAFATALTVLGEDKGVVLIDLQDGYEAFILSQSADKEFTQKESKGFNQFRVK